MIRTHLRSNVVGYLALFVALSGTAVALPATNTVFSDDIVNGEVKTNDISDSDGVRSDDVRDDDKNGGGLAAVDLAGNSVGRSEIAADGVGSPEIERDAVRGPEIAPDGVGASEIAPKSIGVTELKDIREYRGEQIVLDQVAHDGLYGRQPLRIFCGSEDEQVLGATLDWTDTNGVNEAMLSEVILERTPTESATVTGVFDGGGGGGLNPARYTAIVTCRR